MFSILFKDFIINSFRFLWLIKYIKAFKVMETIIIINNRIFILLNSFYFYLTKLLNTDII